MVISDYFVKLGVDSCDCWGWTVVPPPPPSSSFLNYQTKISVNGDDGGDSIQPTLQLLYYAQTELSRGQSLSSLNQHLLR